MSGSIVIDVLLCVLLLAYAAYGARAGLTLSIFGVIGVVAGSIAAFFAIPLVVLWVPASGWRLPAVLVAVVVLIVAGQVIGSTLGHVVSRRLERTPLRTADRVAGAVVNFVLAAVVVSTLAFSIGSLGVPFVSSALGSSRVVQTIDALTPLPVKALEAQVRSAVTQDGLPRLFDAIGAGPAVPVPAAEQGSAAQTAAAASVVKITGNAYQCGQNQSGSGFVVAPGRVLTNAHVVAGVQEPVVEPQTGGALTGRVVYFDSVNDLAVIAVSGLTAKPLTLGADLVRADTAVFDGFPLGGPFQTKPAAVQEVDTVRVPDIYKTTTSSRQVYYLAADVQEGNSGGPVIDAKGQVAGVIFARSATKNNLGFAMTNADVAPVSAQAASLTASVSSGHCTRG